jgi:hypothetical protein
MVFRQKIGALNFVRQSNQKAGNDILIFTNYRHFPLSFALIITAYLTASKTFFV